MNKSKHGIKYTKEILQEAVNASLSIMGVLRYLEIPCAGGTHAHVSNRIKQFEIDTAHFTGSVHNRGGTSWNKKSPSEILVILSRGSKRPHHHILKRALLESGLTYACTTCNNIGEWNGEPLGLEIDHIDGDWLNNLIENLRFLCPNCHSQQKHTNMPHKYRNLDT